MTIYKENMEVDEVDLLLIKNGMMGHKLLCSLYDHDTVISDT